MGLVVIDGGLFGTVQDPGRPGYRAWGVPVGGAFDARSYELANALLGNPPAAAALELTLRGGAFEAEADLALALGGAAMDARIEPRRGPGRSLIGPRSFTLARGDRLVLGISASGARAYLAVAGGWRTPTVLGSRSREAPLRRGDRLPAGPGRVAERHPVEAPPLVPPSGVLRIVDGPDAAGFGGPWEGHAFRVAARSNRMGLRLEGPALPVRSPADRVSAPVLPGAVQVAGGRPIVLGVACGTMGGYPHVAQVISADLPWLGQLRPGDAVRFRRVTLDEARALDRADRQRRAALRARLSLAASDPFGWPTD